jgi:hypothetical protein
VVDVFKLLGLFELSGYPTEVLADGPLGYWRLNETGRPVAANSGSAAAPGIYTGDVILGLPGPISLGTSLAVQVYDVGASVEMGAPADLDLSGDVTVEAWVYWYGIGGATQEAVTADDQYWLGVRLGEYVFRHTTISGDVETLSIETAPSNTWVHIVAVRNDAARQQIGYVNGVEVSRRTYARPPGPNYSLSLASPTLGFQGKLAHVAIYDRVLEPARVAAHYAASFDAFTEQASGPHLTSVLDIVGWPPAERYMPTGVSRIIASDPSGNALSWMLGVAETTEQGLLSVAENGYVNFIDRQTLLTATSAATFGDGGGAEIAYSDIAIRYDDGDLWSTVSVSGATGEAHRVTDATAKTRYGPRTLELSGSMTANENELTDEATYLLGKYKTPTARVESLSFVAWSDDPTLVQLFTRDIGDRITVKRRPPGGGTITQDCIIEGVKHNYSPDQPWTTEWSLVPSDPNTYFVLDTSTLDGTHVLAY